MKRPLKDYQQMEKLDPFEAVRCVGDAFTREKMSTNGKILDKVQDSVFIYNKVVELAKGEISVKELEEIVKKWG